MTSLHRTGRGTSGALALALTLAPTLALTLGAAPGPRGDALRFHVAEGTTLARSFTSRQEVSQDEIEMLLNGQPMPAGSFHGMTLIQESRLEVVDRFESLAGDAPRVVRRTFQKVESTGEQSTENPTDVGRQEDRRHGKSELEGKTVVFTWDAEQEAFAKHFDPEGPEEKLLEGLVEDLDLRELLPSEASVDEGDTWKLEAATLGRILVPGGDLAIVPVDGPPEGEGGGPEDFTPSDAFGELEGSLVATYKGTREVDGARLGVIGLEFSVRSDRDLSERFERFNHGELEIDRVRAHLELEGEAELLWDLAGGHARSFTLSGKLKNQMDIAMTVHQADRDLALSRKMLMSGTCELGASFERR